MSGYTLKVLDEFSGQNWSPDVIIKSKTMVSKCENDIRTAPFLRVKGKKKRAPMFNMLIQ